MQLGRGSNAKTAHVVFKISKKQSNIQKYINFEKFIAQKIFVLEQPSLPHWEKNNKNAL